jgi:hypothetical protein
MARGYGWWIGLTLGLMACGAEGGEAAAPEAGGSAGVAGATAGAAGSAGEGGEGGDAGSGGSGEGGCGASCYQKCLCEGKGHDACVEGCWGGPSQLQRVVLKSEAFTIQPGEEVYRCQNFANPFGKDVEIQATESFMSPGSHHLFAFYKEGATDGALEECSGLEFSSSLHTAQTPYNLFDYPAGVAVPVKASQGIRLAVHYINPSDKPVEVAITAAFYLAEPGTVSEHSGHLFFNNPLIFVAAHSAGKATKTCTLPRDIKLFTATSHMHRFGKKFTAEADDGTPIFETTFWSDPEFKRFDPPLLLKKGQKITYTCEYQNSGDKPLTFGESAVTNEMCILSGRYFGEGNGAPIDCQ